MATYGNVKVGVVFFKHLNQNIVQLGFHKLIFIDNVSHTTIEVKKLPIQVEVHFKGTIPEEK